MGRALVTGFEPFGKEESNPSQKLAEAMDGARIGDYDVAGVVLPVSYRRVGASLGEALESEAPDVVISTGLWAGRTDVTVERVALNVMHARIPDNDGYEPKDSPVVRGGPAAYLSTFPYAAILEDIREAGVPATLSYSAGTFICNALLYHVLHQSKTKGVPLVAGFLHVPNDPASIVYREGHFSMSRASLPFDLMEKAVRLAISDSIAALGKAPTRGRHGRRALHNR
ncbi:MAG TPA: pyroglutamyl-peptidase I [Conexivisphaerales archaeon]|nr:pyroglutamyl-peptidase I [Conexivisphaerales archaeon]